MATVGAPEVALGGIAAMSIQAKKYRVVRSSQGNIQAYVNDITNITKWSVDFTWTDASILPGTQVAVSTVRFS